VPLLPGLSAAQQQRLDAVLPGLELVADLAWGLLDTAVVHVRHGGRDLVVKAGGPDNHHLDREITAHRSMTRPLVAAGRAGRLVHASRELNLLVVSYVPGELVQGRPEEHDPDAHRQAGELLAMLHDQGRRVARTWELTTRERVSTWLDRPHRIGVEVVRRVRHLLDRWDVDRPRVVVPTHGDYQPRNWVVDDGQVAVIDFGRAAWRPAETDLARLAAQQWRSRPDLEEAFLDGYGRDPREEATWALVQLSEAVGTAAWAYQVGDERFEEQGHRMLAEALDLFPSA
jgi:tRNA A-37 threonylcarbamoyl transferase component Bud32